MLLYCSPFGVEIRLPHNAKFTTKKSYLHMPIACVLAELLPFKIYITHEWFLWLPIFFTPKLGYAHGFLRNFSSLLKKGYSRQPFVKLLQQLNDYSENDLVLNLVDYFLASRYASKSSHFVRSITSQNLNQFLKKLVFRNQHEKFYLLIKFEENLRWWADWVGHLTENDPM